MTAGIREIIQKYFENNHPKKVKKVFASWIRRDSSKEEKEAVLIHIWNNLDIKADQSTEKSFNKLLTTIKTKNPAAKKRNLRKALSYAAAIASVIIMSFTVLHYIKEDKHSAISRITVPNGAKSELNLSDGSKIWLNSGSYMEVYDNFGDNERRVKLYGEATFDVAPNKECPFIVETSTVDIRVLGTIFNVNTYKENKEMKVALIEGSVELFAGRNKMATMKPNDLAIINHQEKKIAIYENRTENALNWRQNKLYFNGEAFEDIRHILERNFDIKINVHNKSISSLRFTGDFVNDEKIEQIMNIMASNRKFQYKITGNVIDIY